MPGVTGNRLVDNLWDLVLENKNFALRQHLHTRLAWSNGEVGSGNDDRAKIAVVIEYCDAHSGSDAEAVG